MADYIEITAIQSEVGDVQEWILITGSEAYADPMIVDNVETIIAYEGN